MGLAERVPDVEGLNQTLSLTNADPAKANLAITDGYHRFSVALGLRLHRDTDADVFKHGDRSSWPKNATFASFAGWSSRSLAIEVGADGPRRKPSAGRWFYTKAAGVLLDRDEIALNIIHGQAAIYAEVGLAMRAFLGATDKGGCSYEELGDRLWADRKRLQELRNVHASSIGVDASDAIGELDTARLHRALEPYWLIVQRDQSDDQLSDKERAELILAGNLRLVGYEQERLQPLLTRNLDYLPEAIRQRVAQRFFGKRSPVRRDVLRHLRRLQRVGDLAIEGYQIAATRYVFSMVVGDEELGFGQDLPLPPPANPALRGAQQSADRDRYAESRFFPIDLMTLGHRISWNEWERHDDSMGEGYSTRVDNWLRYGERLSWIANLFRSRQQLSALYEQPRLATPDLALAGHAGDAVKVLKDGTVPVYGFPDEAEAAQ